MTRKERYGLSAFVIWIALAASVLATAFTTSLIVILLAGLAAAGFAGMFMVWRIQDKRARAYRDSALRLAGHITDEFGIYRVVAKDPAKCATCEKRLGCPVVARSKVSQN